MIGRPTNWPSAGTSPSKWDVLVCVCACVTAFVCGQALRHLDLKGRSQREIDAWIEEARVDAILGSCARSLPCVRSGARCYMALVGA